MSQPNPEIWEWVRSDQALSDLLVEIQQKPLSVEEQAEEAFHRVSDMYGLPKNPEDIVYDDGEEEGDDRDDEPRTSVYEELGLLKFLNPDDDPRGTVMAAIYTVKNGYTTDLDEVISKKYGRKIPASCGIGWTGENSAVQIIFPEKDQGWLEAGCKLFVRVE